MRRTKEWTLGAVLFMSLIISIFPVSASDISVGPTSALSNLHRFTVEPYLKFNFGYTDYLLKTKEVQSELEFPLNTLIAGGRVSYAIRNGGIDEWLFRATAGTSLIEPWGVFKDHDWYVFSGYPSVKFSYTESEVEMAYLEFSAEAEKRLFSHDDVHLYGTVKYGYQHIEQDAMGYRGWQYADDPNALDGDPYVYGIALLDRDLKALEYKIIYQSFGFGGRFHWHPSRKLSLSMGLMPKLLYLRDRDDHVLRNKLSTAEGFGFVGTSEVSLTYTWSDFRNYEPYISLRGQLHYLRANTEQTQEWYGDDGATPNVDDTGTKITGITHIVESVQGGISISAGVWYTLSK